MVLEGDKKIFADRLAVDIAFGRNSMTPEQVREGLRDYSAEERVLFRSTVAALAGDYLDMRGMRGADTGDMLDRSLDYLIGVESVEKALVRYGGAKFLHTDPRMSVLFDNDMKVYLVDRARNSALQVDMYSKAVLARVGSDGRLEPVAEPIGKLAFNRFMDISPEAQAFLRREMQDLGNCIDMNHQAVADGKFIALQNPETGLYNIASNDIDSELFGKKLLAREYLRPEFKDGVLQLQGEGMEARISDSEGELNVEERRTTIIKFLAYQNVYRNLQTSNTDYESRNQLAGYAERAGVTLRPAEVKDIVQDFVDVKYQEAEEEHEEQRTESLGHRR